MSIVLQCWYFVFVLACDARYCKARFCNRMSSVHDMHVCVHPSVTFVDQEDHVGCKSWKLIARTMTPTPSLFVAQGPSTYFQGNMGKVWGDYRWVTHQRFFERYTQTDRRTISFWSQYCALNGSIHRAHHAVLPAIAWHLVLDGCGQKGELDHSVAVLCLWRL